MLNIEYSVIMSDVIKSFDCIHVYVMGIHKNYLIETVLLSTQKLMLKLMDKNIYNFWLKVFFILIYVRTHPAISHCSHLLQKM